MAKLPIPANPLMIRQGDERVVGPIQVLDDAGDPYNLSVTAQTPRWICRTRPGGSAIFEIGSASLAASGGKLLMSTGKASGHFYCSMSSQAVSTHAPGPYPTEFEIKSGNIARSFEGPLLIVQERLK